MAPLGPFGADRRVLVGVSGGADSMALALLLARWGKPLACIVDHGLRRRLRCGGHAGGRAPGRAGRAGTGGPRGHRAAAPGCRRGRGRPGMRCCGPPAGRLAARICWWRITRPIRPRRSTCGGTPAAARPAWPAWPAFTYFEAARLLRPLLPIPPARLRATLAARRGRLGRGPDQPGPRTLRARLRRAWTRRPAARRWRRPARHGAGRRARRAATSPANWPALSSPRKATLTCRARSAPRRSPPWFGPCPARPTRRRRRRSRPGSRHARCTAWSSAPAGRLGPGWLLAREPAAVAPPSRRAPARAGTAASCCPRTAPGASIGASRRRCGAVPAAPSCPPRSCAACRRCGAATNCSPCRIWPSLTMPRAISSLRLSPARPAAGAPFF